MLIAQIIMASGRLKVKFTNYIPKLILLLFLDCLSVAYNRDGLIIKKNTSLGVLKNEMYYKMGRARTRKFMVVHRMSYM